MKFDFQAKFVTLAGGLLLLVISMFILYHGEQSKTPEYAVRAITEAIDGKDEKTFAKYVDIDSVIASGYDDFTAGGLSEPTEGEAYAALKEFGLLIKEPLSASFKSAVTEYVKTGEWTTSTEDGIDRTKLASRLGLLDVAFAGFTDGAEVDRENGAAQVSARVKAKPTGEEFDLKIKFADEKGVWRAKEVTNLGEYMAFINGLKRRQMTDYMEKTESIAAKHDKNMREAEFEFQRILAAGSLGKELTRSELKDLMQKVIKKDWQERKEELAALQAPREAADLERLLLRICDLRIAYADGYANWLDDKKVATIRDAQTNLKQADTLAEEAAALIKRIQKDR